MPTTFDHLNNLTVNKKPLDMKEPKEVSTYDAYMISRYISMCEMYLPVVNEINMIDMPKDMHNEYFLSFLPKRRQYFKYIKRKKPDINYEENIELLCKYFECGVRDAKAHYELLDEKTIDDIRSKYEYGTR